MSLATENVVSAPRVMSSCLPISTMSMSFVGFESRSTMLPASFAADVPVFIATPTSACASAGASLVPSPVIATRRPPSCSRRISASLSSGVASARKSSTPASCGDRRGGHRVVARDHDGADPHAAQLVEPLADAGLHDVLEVDDAEHRCTVGRRRAACRRCRDDRVHGGRHLGGTAPPRSRDVPEHGAGRTLAHGAAVEVDPAHARLRRERHPGRVPELALLAGSQPVALLAQHDDRAALGRLVGEAAQLRRVGERRRRRPPVRAAARSPDGCRA